MIAEFWKFAHKYSIERDKFWWKLEVSISFSSWDMASQKLNILHIVTFTRFGEEIAA